MRHVDRDDSEAYIVVSGDCIPTESEHFTFQRLDLRMRHIATQKQIDSRVIWKLWKDRRKLVHNRFGLLASLRYIGRGNFHINPRRTSLTNSKVGFASSFAYPQFGLNFYL